MSRGKKPEIKLIFSARCAARITNTKNPKKSAHNSLSGNTERSRATLSLGKQARKQFIVSIIFFNLRRQTKVRQMQKRLSAINKINSKRTEICFLTFLFRLFLVVVVVCQVYARN